MRHSRTAWQTMRSPSATGSRWSRARGTRTCAALPFPSLGEGTAEQKIERLELALVDEMRARATPESAEQVADAMWGLVHNRDDGDPVKLRVTQHHEELARLSHRGLR